MHLYRLQYSDEMEDRDVLFMHPNPQNFYLDVALSLENAALKAIEADCNLPLTWDRVCLYVTVELEALGYRHMNPLGVDMRNTTLEIPQFGDTVRSKIREHNAQFLLTDYSP